jgi:hypothetical protein
MAEGYIYDCDRGMRTAMTLKDKFTPIRLSADFDEYWDSDVMNPVEYLKLKNHLLKLTQEVNSGRSKLKGVCVDSLTGLCRAAQLHVMKLAGGNSLAIPQIQHYGMIVNEIEGILTILRSLRCLVIVTAHEMTVDKENAVYTQILSATRPHGENRIPWMFDEVLHTYTRDMGQGKKAYYLTGQRTSTMVARTRSGIQDTNFGELGLYGLLKLMGYDYLPAKVGA